MVFSAEALSKGLRAIYDEQIDVRTEIERNIFEETLRLFNEAAAKGLSESYDPALITDRFLHELRTNNAVFSAFKTHRMQNDIAAQLIDPVTGQLKSFDRWKLDIQGMTDHYCHAWLQTEYNTAVIRAHQAADWKHFLEEADVFPNIRWMPTTSITPDPLHEHYWTKKLTLPINHPFWQEHRPGDRWNCKCSLQQTDDPVNASALDGWTPPLPQPGLDNNPAQDGAIFSRNHPYFTEAYPGAARAAKKAVGEQNRMILAERRELYLKYKNDPNYKDVVFDKDSGGISAIHKLHKFSSEKSLIDPTKKKGWYEKQCATTLRKKGHVVILESEIKANNIKTPDGYIDGVLMDIKMIEANGKYAVKDKFHDAVRQQVECVILQFPKKSLYSPKRVADGWKRFLNDIFSKKYTQTIKRVICVVEDEVFEWNIPK